MKKLILYSLLFSIVFLPNTQKAQTFNFQINQSSNCWSFSNQTVSAVVTSTIPGATSYVFTVAVSPVSSCAAPSITNTASNGSSCVIFFPCCGVYTISCCVFVGAFPFSYPVMHTTTLACGQGGALSVTNTAQNTTLCAGSPATISVSGSETYTWSNGSNSSSIVVTPSTSTCYSLTAVSLTGCRKDTLSQCVQVKSCTDINSLDKENFSAVVYPNPAKNNVVVSSAEPYAVRYSIITITGSEVIKGNFTERKTLDISTLPAGIYLFKFSHGKTEIYRKLIIE